MLRAPGDTWCLLSEPCEPDQRCKIRRYADGRRNEVGKEDAGVSVFADVPQGVLPADNADCAESAHP
jgi:hypothetical protein